MNRIIQSLSARVQSLSPAVRKIAIGGTVLIALCLLTVLSAHKNGLPQPVKNISSSYQTFPMNEPAVESALTEVEGNSDLKEQDRSRASAKLVPQSQLYANRDFRPEPRIAYSADLGVFTKDFVHARSSMEDILDRHRGYVSRLRMVGHPDGNLLSASLKVPASEYASALTDLKSIGDVQTDDESADEVVQQHGDLEARLQNARNNARRLEQLLKENSDKSIDADYVQRQLTALRAEIAKLELERHNVDERVVFSSIHFTLREVRETPAQTVSAQLRNAAASGLTDLIASLSGILIFLVGYGPSFVLWAAILFFPARYLWRRSRVSLARESA